VSPRVALAGSGGGEEGEASVPPAPPSLQQGQLEGLVHHPAFKGIVRQYGVIRRVQQMVLGQRIGPIQVRDWDEGEKESG
jgi:hypothetical protein